MAAPRQRGKRSTRRLNQVSLVIIGVCAVIIISVLAGSHGTSHATSPVRATPTAASASALARASATRAKASHLRATARPSPPVGTTAAPPASAPAPAATTASCYPLSNEGTCYEPGEYCRDSDQGTSGVAGDGESITCEDNDGWRWEPA